MNPQIDSQKEHIMEERRAKANKSISKLQIGIAGVCVLHAIEIAYLHGSVAKGQTLPHSDVDIAIVLADVPPPYERLMLELQIQSEIEDACKLADVDVRAINNAPVMVKGKIVQEGQLLYEREKAFRVAFEALTREMYFDYLPTSERMQAAFLKHVHQHGLTSGR